MGDNGEVTITRDGRGPILWASVLPVWVLTGLGCAAVLVFVPADDALAWIALVLAAAVLLTFLAQLLTRAPAHFVRRVRWSVGGAVAIAVVATVIALSIAATG